MRRILEISLEADVEVGCEVQELVRKVEDLVRPKVKRFLASKWHTYEEKEYEE